MLLPVTALLVVPVASKNISNGDTPDLRTATARTVNPPLVALQEGPPTVTVETFTVTDRLELPPGPMQLSVYVVVAFNVPVLVLPLAGSLPDQPPEAVQLLVFVADQISIAVPPLLKLAGLALRKRFGAVLAPAPGEPLPPVTTFPEAVWLFSVMLPSQAVSTAISAQHSVTRRNPR